MLFYVNSFADFRQISRKQFLFSIFIEFINCRPHNLLKYLLKIKVLPCIILLRSLIVNDFIQTPCFAKIPQNILCMLYMKITIMKKTCSNQNHLYLLHTETDCSFGRLALQITNSEIIFLNISISKFISIGKLSNNIYAHIKNKSR